MQTLILCVLTDVPPWLEQLHDNYIRKIKPFGAIEIQMVKPKKSDRTQAELKKKAESDLLMEHLKPQDWAVLLDEKGKDLTSVDFAKSLGRWQMSGKKRLVFVIGGAYGASDDLKKRCQESLRLSSMTMNHLIVHGVLLEQIYRAHTILKNIPYHNA